MMTNKDVVDHEWVERNGLFHLKASLHAGYDPIKSTQYAIDSWIKSNEWVGVERQEISELVSDYLTLGEFDRAKQEIAGAPEIERYRLMANVESAMGNFESAAALYILAIGDGDRRAYLDLAHSLIDRDGVDLATVRLVLNRAIACGDVLAWGSLARSYWLEGDDEKSMTVAMQGVDAGSIGALVRYAYALYGLRCFNSATAASLDALKLGAQESLFVLSCCLNSLGDRETLSQLLASVAGRIDPILEERIISEVNSCRPR